MLTQALTSTRHPQPQDEDPIRVEQPCRAQFRITAANPMKNHINILLCFGRPFSLAVLGLICVAGTAQAVDRHKPPLNTFGWPIGDAEGRRINYSREELKAMENTTNTA